MKILSLTILALVSPFLGLHATPVAVTTVTEDEEADGYFNVDIGKFTITSTPYAGFTLQYKDGGSGTAKSVWLAHRPLHEWLFQHAGSATEADRWAMKLDSSHKLLLYKNVPIALTNPATIPTPSITLDPNGVSSFGDSVTLNGTNNTMPSQANNGASSILTVGLGDGRYFRLGAGNINNSGGYGSFVGGQGSQAADISVAIGAGAKALGYDSIALGKGEVAAGAPHSVAIGIGAAVLGTAQVATAIGDSKASGNYSFAGGKSTASQQWATAFGQSEASGEHSTAGGGSHASEQGATAFGYAWATGICSMAGGAGIATGSCSAAFGNGQAAGPWSNAFGASSTLHDTAIDGRFATASGQSVAKALWATALGNSVASGMGSTSLGYATATGNGAMSAGWSQAIGSYSTALGYNNIVQGNDATAAGRDLTVNTYGVIAVGHRNEIANGSASAWIPTDELFVIGNGSPTGSRSNALTVKKNGDATFSGVIRVKAPAGDIEMFNESEAP
ncbi:MAG: hypothetical protein V4710_02160 [Verrucomicrobiota bacterium]